MILLTVFSCTTNDCPANSIQAPDGSCITNDKTQESDSATTDNDTSEQPISWITLPNSCISETDATDPLNELSELFVQSHVFAEIIDIEADPTHDALWAVGEGGLMSFDISTPSTPSFTKATHPSSWDHRFYQLALGTYPALYATHRDHGLAIYSRSDIYNPELITTIEQPNLGGAVTVGTRLYVSDHTGAIHTFDTSNPLQPVLLNSDSYSGSPWKPIHNGDYLYLADNEKGVVIFSIHDPDSPLYLGQVEAVGGVQDLAISENGTALYAAVGSYGVEVFSLSNPEQPLSLGHTPIHHSVIALDIGGSNLWATSQQDLALFDISTPESPTLIGTDQTEQWAMTVSATADYAYVGDWAYLRVFERLSNASAPDLDLSSQSLQLSANSDIQIEISNFGTEPLNLQGATSTTVDLIIEANTDILEPKGIGWLRLTSTEDFINGTICIASNDPDEPTQSIEITALGEGATPLGSAAPDFTLLDINGQSYTLSDYQGHPVVLVYFATW